MWIDLLPLAYIQYGLYVRKVKITMGYLDRVTDIAITKVKITKGQTTIYKKTTQKKKLKIELQEPYYRGGLMYSRRVICSFFINGTGGVTRKIR
jgi:hypothetical protein